MRRLLLLAALLLTSPASAQEAGWHFSPLGGEGDRAALGCARDSDATDYACLAVRCEDDHAIGLHLHTSRPGGDVGDWTLTIDAADYPLTAAPDASPYHARVAGDVTDLLDELKNGGVAYLEPKSGPGPSRHGISLAGSLYVINQALYFCAPRPADISSESAPSP